MNDRVPFDASAKPRPRRQLRIDFADGAPHPLDAQIERAWRELKALIYRRSLDRRTVGLTGRPVSPETRAKISAAKVGTRPSRDARRRMSAAQRARYEREREADLIAELRRGGA